MRASHAICTALLGSQTSVASVLGAPRDVIHGAYIVELDSDADGPGSLYRTLASDDKIAVDHRRDLRSSIFNAASFQVRDTHDAEALMATVRAKPNVRNVWPVRAVHINNEVAKPSRAKSNLQSIRSRRHQQPRAAADEHSNATTFAPHIQTQVDKLRAEGYTGTGVRVAIVDSGVDYTHPALGGCFGPGCLVEGGYDFSGDQLNPETGIPAAPDDDPYDPCMGHGTHVAGIVAAQARENALGFSGAAPGVKLLAYRVWGCGGGSTNELMIAGFNRAFEDGADIISCSNGYQSGWPQEAISAAAARIVEAGVPVLISEGNDGTFGLFNALTPAVGAGVGGTGAVQNQVQPIFGAAASFTIGGGSTNSSEPHHEFGFVPGEPLFAEENLTLALVNLGTDACTALPDDTPDLAGKLVLLEVPDSRVTRCYPIDQATNLVAKGGRYVMYYARDNITVDEQFLYLDGIRGVGTVPPHRGAAWNELLAQGINITVSLPDLGSVGIDNITNSPIFYYEDVESNVQGGKISQFTTWGPSWELSLSPQFLAPGGQIPGLYPQVMGSYKIMSGTSMAAPLAASIYALIKEARGISDPKIVRSLLSSTAKPQAPTTGNTTGGLLASVAQQGAGLLQAYDAAHSTILLDTDGIALNDTDNFVGTHTFNIQNTGASDVTFALGHAKAVTMYTFGEDADGVLHAWNSAVDGWADVTFDTDKVTVPAGGSSNVTVTVTPPQGLNSTLLPVYSGYVTLKSEDQSLVLPYLGVAGSMISTPVLDARNVYLAEYNNPTQGNRTYTIARPDPSAFINTNNGDSEAMPNVHIHPTVGTPLLRVDILALAPAGHGSNTSSLPSTPFFDRYDTVGTLPGYPVPYAPNENRFAFFKGIMADRTVLPEGTYQFAVSALRVFGNASKAEDWDTVKTVPFNLRYAAR